MIGDPSNPYQQTDPMWQVWNMVNHGDMYTDVADFSRYGMNPMDALIKYGGLNPTNPDLRSAERQAIAALDAGQIPGASANWANSQLQAHANDPLYAGLKPQDWYTGGAAYNVQQPAWQYHPRNFFTTNFSGGPSAPSPNRTVPPPPGSTPSGSRPVIPVGTNPPGVIGGRGPAPTGPNTGGGVTTAPPATTGGRTTQSATTPIGPIGTAPGSPTLPMPTSPSPSLGSPTTTTDFGKLFNPTGYDGTDVSSVPSVSADTLSQPPPPGGQVDFARLFNPTGYDGTTVGYDATDPFASQSYTGVSGPTMSGVLPAPTTSPTSTTASSTTDPTTMPGGFPTGAQTLGQPMYPWLTAYQGNFAAPMTPYQNQGLNAISNFVGGGENLGGAQGYLSNVLSGQYLDPSTNPNLQSYIDSLSGIHDYQDELEKERIGSSMAAGGNALSGARAMAESQYQNESNNQYQNMIAQMLNSNYQMERGLQNSAVPLQMGISNELMGGYGNLMQAGAVPQQTQQAENNAEYQDWLRQISGMQQSFQQPENTMLSLLHSGYPGSSQPNYQASDASSLLAALLGNGSGTSGLLNALFGSGTTGGSTSGGLLGTLGNLLGLGGSSGGGSTDLTGTYDPNNPFGFSMNGNDLSSLYSMYGNQTYDPSNPFGYSYNNTDLSSLMSDPAIMDLLNAFGYSNNPPVDTGTATGGG